jgi:flagellar assembly protein FliH
MSSSKPTGQLHADSAAVLSWTPEEISGLDGAFGALVARREDAIPELRAAAEQAMQETVNEAFSRGYDEGIAAGRSAERAHLATAMDAVLGALGAVEQGAARWVDNAEANIAALAVAVARQIMERELTTSAEIVRELVLRALTEFPAEHPVQVRLNPADLAVIQATADPALPLVRADMVWTGDPRITRGGCLVEGRDRIIDGRVDTALERLYRRTSSQGT